jgi:hypothetical protein
LSDPASRRPNAWQRVSRGIVAALAILIAPGGSAVGHAATPTGTEPMRVIFAMPSTGLGFFPGLAKPVIIDAARLAELDAHELEALVAAARVFERPPVRPPAVTGADRRHYVITVEQGNRRCELQLIDPIDDPDLQRLVRFLEAQAAALRARPRPPEQGR